MFNRPSKKVYESVFNLSDPRVKQAQEQANRCRKPFFLIRNALGGIDFVGVEVATLDEHGETRVPIGIVHPEELSDDLLGALAPAANAAYSVYRDRPVTEMMLVEENGALKHAFMTGFEAGARHGLVPARYHLKSDDTVQLPEDGEAWVSSMRSALREGR